ncbi:type IV pilus modification protein PilV [Halomonas cerina]|uniref:Type IV pilus assembly protein PilV n=1 Tax=Halomonas cerina TaxID=447424 RepID=A0A839VE80_9GAMM|nr:type IV pilus modification protein PilV [Halomonas cerina]MBB3191669.1 type IV pilus assembly protein PilV [Halomonas cerina]
MARFRASRGFTLIEALIALLVLSIGLLGVAGMQLKALQSAHAGYQRSVASLAAQDAQERLWAELEASFPACPDPDDVDAVGWQSNWSSRLPGLSALSYAPSGDCSFTVNVTWNEMRFGGTTETLSYTFRLPGTP